MRFRLVDAAKKDLPVARLCKVLNVSPSGYFAWKNRPASTRQREDLVLLAHVRSAFTLSHETYGSPRMTMSWAAGDRLHKELALTALRRALVVRQPGLGLLHHSERGSQNCSNEYQAELRGHGIVISMSAREIVMITRWSRRSSRR